MWSFENRVMRLMSRFSKVKTYAQAAMLHYDIGCEITRLRAGAHRHNKYRKALRQSLREMRQELCERFHFPKRTA